MYPSLIILFLVGTFKEACHHKHLQQVRNLLLQSKIGAEVLEALFTIKKSIDLAK